MLSVPDYRNAWERNRCWYEDNGFAERLTLRTDLTAALTRRRSRKPRESAYSKRKERVGKTFGVLKEKESRSLTETHLTPYFEQSAGNLLKQGLGKLFDTINKPGYFIF